MQEKQYITIPDRRGGHHAVESSIVPFERVPTRPEILGFLKLRCARCAAQVHIPYRIQIHEWDMPAEIVQKKWAAKRQVWKDLDEQRLDSIATHFQHLPCDAETVAHYYKHISEQREAIHGTRS